MSGHVANLEAGVEREIEAWRCAIHGSWVRPAAGSPPAGSVGPALHSISSLVSSARVLGVGRKKTYSSL